MSEEKKSFVVKDRRRFSSETQETENDEIREKEDLENAEFEKVSGEAKTEEQKPQETRLPPKLISRRLSFRSILLFWFS
jgi:hypothetical protein